MSQTMVLLGLLVASLCVTANAGRDLAETSKLVDLGATLNLVRGAVMNLFADGGHTLDISITIDLVRFTSPVAIAVDNGMGKAVQLDVVVGVVNKLAPIAVAVKVDRLVAITVTKSGETKTFTVDLAMVTTAVNTADTAVTTAATAEDTTVTTQAAAVQLDLSVDITIEL